MKRNTAALIVLISVLLMGGLGAFYAGKLKTTPSWKDEPVSLGVVPTAVVGLIYIAQDRQFFAENGLTVSIKDYGTGTATTEALLKREIDISWVAEFPFVSRVFAKDKIKIVAVVGRFDEQHIFGLKERGINTAIDLKEKKIGIPRNTIAEFYLGRFLGLNGMNIQDISLVDVPPAQWLEAISGGGIDGIIAWEPYSSQLRAILADRVVALPIQSSQPGYGAIAVRDDWIKDHPEVVTRFLKALVQAEDYLIRNSAEAKVILRKRLNFDEGFTEMIWSENQFSLSLDQSLITAMEDEARWMINNGLTKEQQVPDFSEYIYTKGLEAVKPEAVKIIR